MLWLEVKVLETHENQNIFKNIPKTQLQNWRDNCLKWDDKAIAKKIPVPNSFFSARNIR